MTKEEYDKIIEPVAPFEEIEKKPKKPKTILADVIVFLIKCLPVIFVIGYIIFYIAVFVEYKDVPMTEVPAWVAWVLFTKS